MTGKTENPGQKPASPRSTNALENRQRKRRFEIFRPMLEAALQEKEIVRIVDLGGTEAYWNMASDFLQTHHGRIQITLVNPDPVKIIDTGLFETVVGDICDPDLFEDNAFDFVHSNSVIEHVGDWARAEKFANNVLRLGKRHFVRTPNYWFPLEPHFRVPAFQWLPVSMRIWMLTRWNLGTYARKPDWHDAGMVINSINLMDRRQIEQLFAGSDVRQEWRLGLPKSVLAMGESYKATHLTTIRHDRRKVKSRGPASARQATQHEEPARKSSTA